VIEGWSAWDAFYMTAITITTVGYGEVHPLSRAGEAFTVCVMFAGVGTFFYGIALFLAQIAEGRFAERFSRRRFARMLDELYGHCILCGFGRRLCRAWLPHCLNELLPLLPQNALHSADGVPLPVEQMLHAAQQIDVLRAVVTAPASPLHGLDLWKPAFPKTQDVLRDVEFVGDFTNGAESVWRFFHGPVPLCPFASELPARPGGHNSY